MQLIEKPQHKKATPTYQDDEKQREGQEVSPQHEQQDKDKHTPKPTQTETS